MAQARMVEGIIGSYQSSDIAKVCQSECQNMYFERQGSEASAKAILRSISGNSTYLQMPEKNCRGIFRCSRGNSGYPALYACFGSTIYLMLEDDGVPVSYAIGKVSNGYNEPVHFTETGGSGDAHPHLIVVDGAGCFAVDTTLLPMEQKADWKSIALPLRNASTDTLIKPTHCAYLYNYLVINDAGTDSFYLSYQYPFEDETNAGGKEYINDIFQTHKYDKYGFRVESEWMTDNTTALCSTGASLWTFGPRSYQIFSYMNDLNYPFQSPNSAAAAIGILAPNSLAVLGPNIIWLGSSDIGEHGIFLGTGNQVQRISTNDIEREIEKLPNQEDAVGQAWEENHHTFYAITFINGNKTFVYDANEGLWHTRASFDQSANNQAGMWRPQFATFAYRKILFGTREDDKLIYMDANVWHEYDGLVMVRRRKSAVIYNDFSPWYCNNFRLICNNGQVMDPNLNPQVTMSFTWDGSTWSDQVIGLTGEIGRYDWKTEWWNLGYGEILTVEVSCSDEYNFTIIGAKIQAEVTSL